MTGPIEKYYGDVGDSSPFGLVIFIGLKEELHDVPHALTLLFDEPLNVGEIEQDSVHIVTFGPESGLVPQGKYIVKLRFRQNIHTGKVGAIPILRRIARKKNG